ncbi:MAG: transglycosylase SLT domain-containing protein [Bdellovibrionales bacterium]|nr:transglycosylase SLT domain-containing protein [Bdellovibrionales bacterium]
MKAVQSTTLPKRMDPSSSLRASKHFAVPSAPTREPKRSRLTAFLVKQGIYSVVVFLVLSAFQSKVVDLTGDFSFSLVFHRKAESNELMTPDRVERILRDHLDSFPKAWIPRLANHLLDLCRKHQFDPALILSVIRVESAFKVKARSPVGAMGLMQIMPATAFFVAKTNGIHFPRARALEDPFTNLTIGINYLAHLRNKYSEVSPYYQFAAYNMGPARLDQLRREKGKRFRGTTTRDYYEAIRRGVPVIRSYSTTQLRRSVLKHGA